MLVGGTQLPIAGAGGGQQAITLQANGSSQYAGTSANAVGSASNLTQERRQQLLAGAPPANMLEQAWMTLISNAIAGVVQQVVQSITRSMPVATGSEDHAFEQQVLALVNVERARGGLAPLVYDGRLDLASERHNQQQALTRSMAHDGIGDGTPGERIRAAGVTTNWGENVATGQLSAEQVVREWMASPGHRRNIMDPTFRRLGVSYTVGSDGRTYWAQSFGG